VRVQNLWKIYNKHVKAVKGITFDCGDGEFLSILGPSGCGKTSTLRMIAGLEAITEGQIFFDSQLVNDWSPQRRNVAMAFEDYALYPHMSVYENIAYPLRIRGERRKQIDQKVRSLAANLGIQDVLTRKPRELSGGQQQRVSLARALVRNPSVLLMDEPISHLDLQLRHRMRGEIKELQRKIGVTCIYVTHDQLEALTMADRVIVMNKGEIQQIGTPDDLYERPANQFVGGFIGSPPMNFLPVEIEKNQVFMQDGEQRVYLGVICEAALKEDLGRAVLGIRPADIQVVTTEEEATFEAVVAVCEPLGEKTIVTADYGALRIKIELAGLYEVEVGKRLLLKFPRESLYLFDPQTTKCFCWGLR